MSVEDVRNATEAFLASVRRIRHSGRGTPERTYYPSIKTLLDTTLAQLSPKRESITDPAGDTGDFPDLSVLETRANIVVLPAEIKNATVTIDHLAGTEQARRYATRFGGGVVLLSNLREFALARMDSSTGRLRVEGRVVLASSESELDARGLAVTTDQAADLIGLLDSGCQVRGNLTEPSDVARLLAYHACRMRDAIEATGEAGTLLEPIHAALNVGLSIDVPPALLVPTVVQTLVYGLFASWLEADRDHELDWMETAYRMDVPVFADILHEALRPALVRRCDLKSHLNATARVLSWVDHDAFAAKFDGDAIQYFYEPFLAEFDAELRDRLGVWYTPREVAAYQVARVDHHLRVDLGISEGILSADVYALDPAAGTGTYVAELLTAVYEGHLANGEAAATAAARTKEAALSRIVGFEILPAAFIISHIHIGRMLARWGAPLIPGERARIFLTNSLLGWDDDGAPTGMTLFPELEKELHDAAVAKHSDPVIAILGNPPYQGYSSAETREEAALIEPWVRTLHSEWGVRKHRLNDLYIRFWRVSIKRIADMTGRGIVSFITNRKWLGGRSYPAMRESIVQEFQLITVDDLHGAVDDKSHPGDESIFTTRVATGITRATAIVTAVRTRAPEEGAVAKVTRRDLLGSATHKRSELESFRGASIDSVMASLPVSKATRWRLVTDAAGDYPPLDDYLPIFVSGVQPVRDEAVTDTDRQSLVDRMTDYFDDSISWDDLLARHPGFGVKRARYKGPETRSALAQHSQFYSDRVVRFMFRPMDVRWLYWEPDKKLLNEARRQLRPYFLGLPQQYAITTPQTPRRVGAARPLAGGQLAAFAAAEPDARVFPLYTPQAAGPTEEGEQTLDLPDPAAVSAEPTTVAPAWVEAAANALDLSDRKQAGEIIFFALIAVLNSPAFLATLPVEMDDFPQVPIPADPNHLQKAADLGRELAALYDPDVPVRGVIQGVIHPHLRGIAVPDNVAGQISIEFGKYGQIGGRPHVWPGPIDQQDIMWDDAHGWRNVPAALWDFTVAGHRALPKWLSYRKGSPGTLRTIGPNEREQFMMLARRVAQILHLSDACDAIYLSAQANPLATTVSATTHP